MTENDMVQLSYVYFKDKKDFDEIVLEVPFLSRSIDMVLIDTEDKVWTIEFKLKNWKQAIKQAEDHRLGADYAYICMPRKKNDYPDEMYQVLKEKGIGLMLFDQQEERIEVEKVVTPTTMVNRWSNWTKSLRNMTCKIALL